MRKKQANINNDMIGPIIPKVMYIILKQKKCSQNIYTILNQNKDEPTGKCKWNEIYTIDEKSWEYIFQAPFMITKCTKFRWFQTTINHRILTTNKLLFQMNLIDSPKCTFCGNNDETIGGWSGGAKVLCILHHRGVQLILAYSWARPAILVVGKGRGGMFLFLLFLHFHSCSSFFPVPLIHLLYSLFYLFSPFLWETTQNDPQGLMCR